MSMPRRGRYERSLQRRINALYPLFADVALDHSHVFLDDRVVQGLDALPTLRAYYRDALNLAVAVIEQRAVLIDSRGGSVRLPSIVVNMNYVFEAYIRHVLRLQAEGNGWDERVLDGNDEGRRDLFNEKPSELATPDIVIEDAGEHALLVLEVKNVPVKSHFSERDAMNQALTYGVSFGTRRVVLVHPRASAGQSGGMRRLGAIGPVELHQYRFDLGAEDLEQEEAAFAQAVRQLLPKVISSSAR